LTGAAVGQVAVIMRACEGLMASGGGDGVKGSGGGASRFVELDEARALTLGGRWVAGVSQVERVSGRGGG